MTVQVTDGNGDSASVFFADNVSHIAVRWDQTELVTGYTIDANGKPKGIAVKATGKIVGDITKIDKLSIELGAEAPTRAVLGQVKLDAANKTVSVEVLGQSASPASQNPTKNASSTDLRSIDKSNANNPIVQSAIPVFIEVPSKAKTGTKTEIKVKAINRAMNSTTTPPWPGLAANMVQLLTSYETFLTVQVLNQWGQPLSAIYAGLEVEEIPAGGATFTPLNVKTTANGTYPDWVSWAAAKKNPVPAGGKEQNDWEGMVGAANLGFQIPVGGRNIPPAKIPVRIGGHELAGGIMRRVKLTPDPNDPTRRSGTLEITPE